jgi:segregation and condensation protein A
MFMGGFMEYKIDLPIFEGPLDLLLHLIKQDNIDIMDISIDKITKQYLDYINLMEELNLDIASEYLVMAAELIEIKSHTLLPHNDEEVEDEFEEDPRQRLINRLLEYKYYKESTAIFSELEEKRSEMFTKEASELNEYIDRNDDSFIDATMEDLLNAFAKFLENKENLKPLKTKITNKEYSVSKRCIEIKDILRKKKKVSFKEIIEDYTKEYIVVTFLAILSMCKKEQIQIEQENNFKEIIIKEREK